MEKIKAAAILHGNGKVYSLPAPNRHHNIINTLFETHGVRYRDGEERAIQGFITDADRFVDRYEAKEIATKAGQLLARAGHTPRLFSEDVW